MLITRSMELLSCLSSVWLSFDRYSSNRCNALWVSCFRTGIFLQNQEGGTHLVPRSSPPGGDSSRGRTGQPPLSAPLMHPPPRPPHLRLRRKVPASGVRGRPGCAPAGLGAASPPGPAPRTPPRPELS